MEQYYATYQTVNAEPDAFDEGDEVMETLSEFDKHRETLLSDDTEEGWASELRRYLKTIERGVKKETDIVEWWQVCILHLESFLFANLNGLRTMLIYIRHSGVLRLMSSPLKHHLCPVNDCSRVQNKLLLTAGQAWVLWSSKRLPLQSRHGDLDFVMLRLGTLHRRKRLDYLIMSRCWLRMLISRSGIKLCK